MLFINRVTAGYELSKVLEEFKNEDCIVVGITHGGMVVAEPIAKVLHKPLRPIVVQKLILPQTNYASGAITSKGGYYLDKLSLLFNKIDYKILNTLVKKELIEVVKQERKYKEVTKKHHLINKKVILVDDGLATGATVKAAAMALRKYAIKNIILAVPVIAESAEKDIRYFVDEVINLHSAKKFKAVSDFYANFPQVSDNEVIAILKANQI